MKLRAILFAAAPPDDAQRARFEAFLNNKYGDVELEFRKSTLYPGGFRLEVGSEIYDWSISGRFRQLRDVLTEVPDENGNIVPLLRESVRNWTPRVVAEEIGTVLSVGDGIATVGGLPGAEYGEILLFADGTRGMVQDLSRETVGCILFGDDGQVEEGSAVRRTKKRAGVPVGEQFLGRVVNALGDPVDGKGEIAESGYRPIETPAPSIIDRQPVKQPMETGLIAIDSMFPIGRGQRELIIGDRQTGKTAIAVDTILNQKGEDVICIYVSIGQKASSLAKTVNTLRNGGAMDYTCIVCSTADDSVPMQYIAPYSGCALAEYFMYQIGRASCRERV